MVDNTRDLDSILWQLAVGLRLHLSRHQAPGSSLTGADRDAVEHWHAVARHDAEKDLAELHHQLTCSQCLATRRDGEPCKGFKQHGSDFCFVHAFYGSGPKIDPVRDEEERFDLPL